MKILLSLLLSLLLVCSTAFAANDERWLLAGTDVSNETSWYIDSKTLKVHDNKTVLFWAKVVLSNPKYDITEIKIKYLLSADRLQLTKLEESGYSKKGETVWNNNVTRTISVIPGSGPEKLVLFVDEFIQKQEAAKAETDKSKKQTETATVTQDLKQQSAGTPAEPNTDIQAAAPKPAVKAAEQDMSEPDAAAKQDAAKQHNPSDKKL